MAPLLDEDESPDELETEEEIEVLEIWLLEQSELSELSENEKLLSDSGTCLLLLKRSADVIVLVGFLALCVRVFWMYVRVETPFSFLSFLQFGNVMS